MNFGADEVNGLNIHFKHVVSFGLKNEQMVKRKNKINMFFCKSVAKFLKDK